MAGREPNNEAARLFFEKIRDFYFFKSDGLDTQENISTNAFLNNFPDKNANDSLTTMIGHWKSGKCYEVFIENDTVTIRGERGEYSQEQEKSYFYQECYWGAFQRKIILPEEVDASRGTSELKKGILCVRIPKTERKKRRKINIKE